MPPTCPSLQIRRCRNLSDIEKQRLTGWGRDIYQSEALNLLWRPKEDHLVLYLDNEPVSHCGLIRQDVLAGEEIVSVGGIGGVVTPPAYQGRGYARRVLTEALTIFTTEHHQFALLFCREPLRSFYQSLGWQAIKAPVNILQPSGAIPFPAHTLVYPLDDALWPSGSVNIDSPPW